jgi:hypothetical protein
MALFVIFSVFWKFLLSHKFTLINTNFGQGEHRDLIILFTTKLVKDTKEQIRNKKINVKRVDPKKKQRFVVIFFRSFLLFLCPHFLSLETFMFRLVLYQIFGKNQGIFGPSKAGCSTGKVYSFLLLYSIR